MKRLFALLVGVSLIGFVGCAEKASTKTQTTTSGQGGTTTVTSEKEVKTTGENPPAPAR
jgi:hypothetical protein